MYHKSRKPKEFLKLLMHAERLVRRKKKQNGGQKKRKGSNIIVIPHC
jgi:hypothetical protein